MESSCQNKQQVFHKQEVLVLLFNAAIKKSDKYAKVGVLLCVLSVSFASFAGNCFMAFNARSQVKK